jgi:hypothetical protein
MPQRHLPGAGHGTDGLRVQVEPPWIATGIAEGDPRWLAATLGPARDINPIGTKLA